MSERLDREAALHLLREQHSFPGPFEFRVVVRPDARERVVDAVRAAIGLGRVLETSERPSKNERYFSVRVLAEVDSAEAVLDVFAVLSELDGVLMTL